MFVAGPRILARPAGRRLPVDKTLSGGLGYNHANIKESMACEELIENQGPYDVDGDISGALPRRRYAENRMETNSGRDTEIVFWKTPRTYESHIVNLRNGTGSGLHHGPGSGAKNNRHKS
jgi:hypothetical protein